MNENDQTFVQLCLSGSAEPKNWKAWLYYNKIDNENACERLGVLSEEYEDLNANKRSFDFYVFKRKSIRSIFKVWGGCYVKYAYENNLINPHAEFGWVDSVSNATGFCKIQCDDNFYGNRAVMIRTIDIMEILPMKERFLVYYKTMLCGKCNDCDRSSNDEPPITCRHYELFNAILGKQHGDNELLKILNDSKK